MVWIFDINTVWLDEYFNYNIDKPTKFFTTESKNSCLKIYVGRTCKILFCECHFLAVRIHNEYNLKQLGPKIQITINL